MNGLISRIPSLFLLAGLLSIGGCLFTKKIEPVNEPPTASIELQTGPSLIHIGERVFVSAAKSEDPDGDELTYEWSIEYEVGVEDAYGECGPESGAVTCDGGDGADCCFVPQAKTSFTVRLRVYDDEGLRSERKELVVPVNNRPPEAVISAETMPNASGHYTVGQEIWSHAFQSSDPDDNDELSYEWWAERPPGSDTELFVLQPSDTAHAPTMLAAEAVRCLMIPDHPGTYVLHLAVSDGQTEESTQRTIEVDEDSPPCIGDTAPGHAAVNPVLFFDLGETRRLEVLRVGDDLDPYPPAGSISFTWQLNEAPAEGFRTVPGYGEPYLDIDTDDYSAGQQIQVRVIIHDRKQRDLSSCSPQDSTCSIEAGCAQWVTWKIEFR
jgi:hypothetical protein